jgi:hypothetical protein
MKTAYVECLLQIEASLTRIKVPINSMNRR